MKIVYRITEEDYAAAYKLFMANEMPLSRRASRMLLPWFGGIMLLLQVAYLIVVPNPNPLVWGLGSLVGFYFVYCRFALRSYFARSFRNDRRFLHDFTSDISDEGIHTETFSADSHTKWSAFVRFLESDKIFMLFHSEWIFIIIPKSAFEPTDVEQFRELALRNVPSSSQ